jgi:hypothetical protein
MENGPTDFRREMIKDRSVGPKTRKTAENKKKCLQICVARFLR